MRGSDAEPCCSSCPQGGAVGRGDRRVSRRLGLAMGLGRVERRPGVRAERVLALSPGNVDVTGAKAQARRVRAGHGRTRSGKGSASTGLRQGWGGTRYKAGSPRRSPAPPPSEASQHFPTSRANAFGGAGFHGFAVSCGFAVS